MATSPRPEPPSTGPHAVILAGPNGAGKSTLAPALLAGELGVGTFVNADVIAQGLAGFDPASAALQAGRIMLERLDALRRARASFAFETTLSGLAHQRTLRDLHASGYTTSLIYISLPDAEWAVQRVRGRVRMGGHDVPEGDIRRRFVRSLCNFDRIYRKIATRWWLYDSAGCAGQAPSLISRGGAERIGIVHNDGEGNVSARKPRDIGALLDDPATLDRAFRNAFHDAVRRHRQANVPMIVRKNGKMADVSPFDIPLPEDEGEQHAAD